MKEAKRVGGRKGDNIKGRNHNSEYMKMKMNIEHT